MKPLIIAGNGPSLAQIDYSRLPLDFEVFRCNQFYFEDHYFLGKKIQGVFFNPSVLKEQFFTLHHLKARGEYEVRDVYCQREDDEEFLVEGKHFKSVFPQVKSTYDFLKTLPAFNELDKFYRLYFAQWPTMGIVMLYTAIAQNYKEIYLTGIDFYEGANYAFALKPKSYLAEVITGFAQPTFKDFAHSKEVDLKFLSLALSLKHLKLYALSPQSPLAQILPLAPRLRHQRYIIQEKPQGFIADLLPSPSVIPPRSFRAKMIRNGVDRRNIYVVALLDLLRIFRALLRLLKS